MKKSIKISIPEPCHEDWAKMTATEKGKFCDVCTKEVFDFTSKTDEELVKFVSKNKSACGRFNKSQLNREVKLERKSSYSLAPFAASLLLPLTLFSNNLKNKDTTTSEKPIISLGVGRYSNSASERIQIVTTGTITDQNGRPIKNVEITSNESGVRAWTNRNGEFRIVTLDHEKLLFSKENYTIKEYKLSHKSISLNITLQAEIKPQHIILGNMAIDAEQLTVKDSLSIKTHGMVTDDTGLSLPGTNVFIKGTSKGTQTDFDGNYTIETKSGDVLVFSYVGFETKEITVSNTSNSIDIQLVAVEEYSLGIVVVGGISFEEYQPPKDAEWKRKVKQAYKNTLEFQKIKKERRKAVRRAQRKK